MQRSSRDSSGESISRQVRLSHALLARVRIHKRACYARRVRCGGGRKGKARILNFAFPSLGLWGTVIFRLAWPWLGQRGVDEGEHEGDGDQPSICYE